MDGAMVANNLTLESKLLRPDCVYHGHVQQVHGCPGGHRNSSSGVGVAPHWGEVLQTYPPLKEMLGIDELREEQMEELMRDTRMYIRRNKTLFSGLAVLVMEQPSRVDRWRGWSGRSGGSCSILINMSSFEIIKCRFQNKIPCFKCI